MDPTRDPSVTGPAEHAWRINALRFLAVDAVQQAASGHPGMPLGAAPMAYVLWTRFLRHCPSDPQWPNRDRFVLSAGHGSALLYSLLHLTGYDLPLEEMRRFRQWGSRTPGHPERGLTPGVEVTTGPLGQGFGNAVGMAIAEAHLAAWFNRPGYPVIDHFTFVLASDGDLMEGVSSEAASLAGELGLGKLICLYDDNHVTLAGATDLTFREDKALRFAAYGWHVATVGDGNDLAAIEAAIRSAQEEKARPSIIMVRTHIGYGSPHKQDSFEAHGSPLGEEEVRLTKQNLGWPEEPPFFIPEDVLAFYRTAIDNGKKLKDEWRAVLAAYRDEYTELAAELDSSLSGRLPLNWDVDLPVFPPDAKGLATRAASGETLNCLASRITSLFGGSADLNPSTLTAMRGAGDFQDPAATVQDRQGAVGDDWSHAGRNVAFGVREHGMGAITNGLAAHGGLIPFASTFLIFSDYMRPPMRLAALMKLHVVYVFTHDSIGLGEDGPTHEPVEQLANLRAIPGMTVIRPADANETVEAWKVAVEHDNGPVALVLTRQKVPTIDRDTLSPAGGLRRGAYVLADPTDGGPVDLVLVATGSEVSLALSAGRRLAEQGVRARVVSMPSWELFERQDDAYRESVFPSGLRARVAIEAASPQGWDRYVGAAGAVVGVRTFGASAPGEKVLEEYGYTVENAVTKGLAVLAASSNHS
ncbi:MAG: transketolase [Actinobacteria bacterium]|nr:transketolase [Actinomycetota bacterium]